MRCSPLAGAVLAALTTTPTEARAGDPGRGERVFQYCYACHSVEPGETNLQGPNLIGIVGRRVAAETGFDYSPALRAFAQREPVWTEALLDRFVAEPEELVPKTSMHFGGIDETADREDLVVYLRSRAVAPR